MIEKAGRFLKGFNRGGIKRFNPAAVCRRVFNFISGKISGKSAVIFFGIVFTSCVTALFISRYISYRLFVYGTIIKTPPERGAGGLKNKKVSITGYGSILKDNIFGLKIDGALMSSNPAGGFVPLSAKLVGVIHGGLNYGFFLSGSKIIFVKEGAFVLPGYLLQKVNRKSVVIGYGGKQETIRIIKSGGETAGTDLNGLQGKSRTGSVPHTGSIVKKTGSGSYVISRQGIKRLDIPLLYTQMHAVPDMSGGEIAGYKILNIVPGSIFWDMGLRKMDVIKDVNGVPLKSPQEAVNLMTGLQNENSLNLNILRNGNRITLNYKIE